MPKLTTIERYKFSAIRWESKSLVELREIWEYLPLHVRIEILRHLDVRNYQRLKRYVHDNTIFKFIGQSQNKSSVFMISGFSADPRSV